MHQVDWAQRFGGYGAPDWSVEQYSQNDAGMRETVSNFWANPSLQDHLINVWKNIASYYANEPTVAGYDLLNEPMVYTSIIPNLNESNVNAYYRRATAAIRTVDPNHIIFLEPANCMYSIKIAFDSKIVWEPHFYPLSFFPNYYLGNVTVLEADMAAKYQTIVMDAKVPMWIGEFGAFMKDTSANDWLTDAKNLFDKYQVGWAWWAYSDQKGNSIPNCLQNPVTYAIQGQTPPVLTPIFNFKSSTKNCFQIHAGNRCIK